MEPQGAIIPTYVVADQSGSMDDCIGELNEGLMSLLDGLQRQPFAASKVRFSVIGFSDRARTYMEPTDLRWVTAMPILEANGLTSYAAAFNEVAERISEDVPALKAEGFSVVRPLVFFLTDGRPNIGDCWETARANLLGKSTSPNIVSFGIGLADVAIVAQIATKPEHAFVAIRGADTGEALTTFFEALTQSVINSGQALGAGLSDLAIEQPAGFSLAVDLI